MLTNEVFHAIQVILCLKMGDHEILTLFCWGPRTLRISTTRPLKQNSITEQAAGKDS